MNQQQASKTPKIQRDKWESPLWIVDWVIDEYQAGIDLACNADNQKCSLGIYENENSLIQKWHILRGTGFCNPPYSNIKPWLKKGYEESLKGFRSIFLVPTPNGESVYKEWVFGKAQEIIYINGRVAFCRPDGTEVKGNTRGSCLIVYEPEFRDGDETYISWYDRDYLIQRFQDKQKVA